MVVTAGSILTPALNFVTIAGCVERGGGVVDFGVVDFGVVGRGVVVDAGVALIVVGSDVVGRIVVVGFGVVAFSVAVFGSVALSVDVVDIWVVAFGVVAFVVVAFGVVALGVVALRVEVFGSVAFTVVTFGEVTFAVVIFGVVTFTVVVETLVVQCVQKLWSDYFYLVFFGDFKNLFRSKNRNFQNCLAGSFGLVLIRNFENFDRTKLFELTVAFVVAFSVNTGKGIFVVSTSKNVVSRLSVPKTSVPKSASV